MTTFTAIAVVLFVLALSLVLNALFLSWGVRWAKKERTSFKRCLAVVCLVSFVQTPIAVGFEVLLHKFANQSIVLAIGSLVLCLLISIGIVSYVFKLRFWRALQAWFVMACSVPLALLILSITVRPFLFEAYLTATNSMAPALLGEHWEFECPECKADAFCSPIRPDASGRSPKGLMICSKHRKTFPVAESPSNVTTHSADRVLVNKLIAPQRFDIIVFRVPSEPEVMFQKRLIGLPGETVVIREGQVWIDEELLELPESLKGLEYLDEFEFMNLSAWGHESQPAKLGADEYYVLGDFSALSLDSRFWRKGAAGHPPYAVPEENITGVVTHIYWPVNRWRIFR